MQFVSFIVGTIAMCRPSGVSKASSVLVTSGKKNVPLSTLIGRIDFFEMGTYLFGSLGGWILSVMGFLFSTAKQKVNREMRFLPSP